MIGKIPPEKAESILRAKKENTPEESDFWRLWKIAVYTLSFLTIFMNLLQIKISADGGEYSLEGALTTIGITLLTLGIYLNLRYGKMQRFKKAVEKYGKTELIKQINDPSTHGYFIEQDNYFFAIILTPDYLISANDFLVNLKEAESIEIRRKEFKESNIRFHKNDCVRMIFRCTYRIWIKKSDCRMIKEGIAIRSKDLAAFISALKLRAPNAEITCDGMTEDDPPATFPAP